MQSIQELIDSLEYKKHNSYLLKDSSIGKIAAFASDLWDYNAPSYIPDTQDWRAFANLIDALLDNGECYRESLRNIRDAIKVAD